MGTRRRPVALVAMLILMAIVVIEPVGVLGHFLHDHIGAHAHWGDSGGFTPVAATRRMTTITTGTT